MRHKLNLDGLLRSLPLFRNLDAAQLSELAGSCREVRVPRHGHVFRRGDAAPGLYVVAVGQIKLALPSLHGNPEKVVEFFGPGQAFGEAVMFLDRPYLVDAQALEDTLLILLGKKDIFAAIDRDPSFARRMLAGLSMRLHSLVQDIETVNLQNAQQRVIGYLLNRPREGNLTRFAVNKNLIASKLGLSPATLSRALQRLSEAALISVAGPEVVIHDVQALQHRFSSE
ncbi:MULTISPECIES: Crp/Fnr family transcriptional regulator [Cupriavidus]